MTTHRCPGCMRIKQSSPICEHCGHDDRTHNAPHQLPVGTVLQGQYVIGKVLGQGGFGITYIGWDRVLEIPIAIKEYYPGSLVTRNCTASTAVYLSDPQFQEAFVRNRERFAREARSLARLDATESLPNIVRVHNMIQANNTAYIIMEYVKGNNLHKYMALQRRPLTLKETLNLLLPIMDSLDKIHRHNLVHRDISPDNIMVLPDGTAKLIDFGAAHEQRISSQGRIVSTDAIVKHGFAPAEQYQRSGKLGPWTDVYAMCSTIYYCLSGEMPPSVVDRLTGDSDFLWDKIPGIRPEIITILKKGTALQKENRYQTMEKLRSALLVPERRIHPAVIAAAAVILAALILWQLRSVQPPPPPTTEPTIQTQPTTEPTIQTPPTTEPTIQTQLTEEPTAIDTSGFSFTDLELIRDSNSGPFDTDVVSGSHRDHAGEYHNNSLCFRVRKGEGSERIESARYRMHGNYTEISGLICAEENCDSRSIMTVELWVDGIKVYTSEPITSDSSIPFHVDFSDVVSKYGGNSLIVQCLTNSTVTGYCIVEGWLH